MKYKHKKGDLVLITELAKGVNNRLSAKAAGVSIMTVSRRLNDSLFRREVSKQRRKALDLAAGILAEASAGAAKVLNSLAQNRKQPGHVRRSAARDVLDHSMRMRENLEIEERLLDIEEKLREME